MLTENDQIYEELNHYCNFFKNPITLPLEETHHKHEVVQNTEEKSPGDSQATTQVIIPTIESGVKPTRSSIGKNKSYKHTITDSCKCFFAIVKPYKAPKGKRKLFIFVHPYCGVYDNESTSNTVNLELEIFHPESSYFADGRFLYVVDKNGSEKKFSIKSNLNVFKSIITASYKTNLIPFLLSVVACNVVPEPNSMLQTFYNKSLYTNDFLECFSGLPNDLLNDEVLDNWIRAADPTIDIILSHLLGKYFNSMSPDSLQFPQDEFAFKIIAKMLKADEEFKEFAVKLSKEEKDICQLYVSLLETFPYNNKTHMMLHVLYDEARKVFPDTQIPSLMCSFTIFDGVLSGMLKELNPDISLSPLYGFVDFSQTTISLKHLKVYEKTMNLFRKQPTNYVPCTQGSLAFEAFTYLLGLVVKKPSDFLNVARRHEKFDVL